MEGVQQKSAARVDRHGEGQRPERPLDAFDAVCKHEAKVTGLINKLVDQARKEPDHATDNMLQWFVAEQVEEEDTADKIRSRIKLVGDKGHGLHMIDRELATRVFTPPAAEGE